MNREDLKPLYVELDGVCAAMERAMSRVEWDDLNKRRGKLLGQIKEGERNVESD